MKENQTQAARSQATAETKAIAGCQRALDFAPGVIVCSFDMHGYCTARVADVVAMVSQKQLREQIHQDRYAKKDQPDFEQRLQINIGCRFGEFIRDHAGQGVSRREERRGDLRRVADHHRHRHRFAERAAQPENHRAEQPFLGVT